MKSVGEVMAIGRTFQESLQKALRGLEVGVSGFDPKIDTDDEDHAAILFNQLAEAGPDRIWYLADAFRQGMSCEEIFGVTKNRSLVLSSNRRPNYRRKSIEWIEFDQR